MSVCMVTNTGEKHGLINEIINSVPFDEFKNMKPDIKAKCEKLKKEENRIVKARYVNSRGVGERLTKPYCRWSGDPIRFYNFIPNHVYEVPLGLVNEVNASQGLVQRSEILDASGVPTKKDGDSLKIHHFYPLDF